MLRRNLGETRATRPWHPWIWPLIGACALSCASYRGSARDATVSEIARDAGWKRVEDVSLVRQKGEKDCGAAALSTVLTYWEPERRGAFDRRVIDEALRRDPGQGLVASELRDYARRRGFSAFVLAAKFEDLQHEIQLGRPVIVGVHKPLSDGEALAHYEVFIGYHPEKEKVLTLDPAHGLRENDTDAFLTEWKSTGHVTLVVIPPDAEPPAQPAAAAPDAG